MPRPRTSFSWLLAAALAASAVALSSCGGTDGASSASASGSGSETAAIEPLPTRNPRAKAVEPVAGESAESAALASAEPADQAKTPARS